MIKFILDGCDIQFIAEAPADITLEQLLKQCDKIKPHWCACGIKSYDFNYDFPAELRIDYDSIVKLDSSASCDIEGEYIDDPSHPFADDVMMGERKDDE